MSEPAEVVINGVDRTNYLSEGASLTSNARYTLELGQRGEATVSLVVPDGDSYAPAVGQPISLYDFGVRKVGGLIASIREQWYESDNNRVYEITIASFERFLDKHEIPVVAYSGMSAGDIVTALFTLVAASETITLGTIQPGPTIPFMVFDHDRLTDVFDNLAVTAGFVWFVEPGFETLEFKVQTAVPAPWTLVDDGLAGTFQWTKNNQDFRDRQRIRINYDAFPPEVDVFVGDGSTTTATLSKIPAQVLAVVNTTSTQCTTPVTFTGNPSNGDTFTITDTLDGYAITYTFVTILDNTIEFQVLIGATGADTADNLCSAINGDPNIAFQGVIYSWPTYTNGRMRAYPDNPSPGQFLLKSKMPGGNGNAVLCGSFSPAITVGATDDGGSDGVNASLAIGRLAVDTQKDAYWDYGSTTITFPAAPAAGQLFYVTYYPLGSDVITVEDSFLKSQRASIEGGSGLYEQIQDRSNTNDPVNSNVSAAIQQAREMLVAYKTLPEGLTFSTYRTGLEPGQLLTVSLAGGDPFGDVLNGDWLIRQVDAEYTPGYQWRYTIQAIAESSSPPASIPRISAPLKTWEKFVDKSPPRRLVASQGAGGFVHQEFSRLFSFGGSVAGLGGENIVVNDLTNTTTVGQGEGGTLTGWDARACGAAPTGSDAILDILLNGSTIFQTTKIVIPAGSTSFVIGTGFLTGGVTVLPGDKLQGKVIQKGSTIAGKDISVNLYWS